MDMTAKNVNRRDFPRVRHPNQTFIDAYNEGWNMTEPCWVDDARTGQKVYAPPGSNLLDQTTAIFSSFVLAYSNGTYNPAAALDAFYARQETSGAIRSQYDLGGGGPVFSPDNPEGIGLPLFPWAEYNLYHKAYRENGNKEHHERIKKVLPILDRYAAWIDASFIRTNGLYETPGSATGVSKESRRNALAYYVDFNSAMAIFNLYMSALAGIVNDKERQECYRERYLRLKQRIQVLMWDNTHGGFCDIDEKKNSPFPNTGGSFWTLLAEIPESDQAARVAARPPGYDYWEPHHCFVFIKGLERYQRWSLAQDAAARYLNAAFPDAETLTKETYRLPIPSSFSCPFAKSMSIPLMIENVLGLHISLPRKTVDWILPTLEDMGIENLSFQHNRISLHLLNGNKGWEVNMENEEVYYFTINIPGSRKKIMPVPSGKHSMLIDEL
jgi:neutral trehalase